MLKSIYVFFAALAVSLSASATTVAFSNNSDGLGDGKPFILLFDGAPEMGSALVGKILGCYETFSDENKAALLKLFDVPITELRENHAALIADPHANGYLTVDSKEPHQAFVSGAFQQCLNRN